MLKLGNIKLDMPVIQAPLSGYTDRAMRTISRRFGAPLTFTGVLLDKIALHKKAVRKLLFQPSEDEHPVGAQIIGANPDTMAKAAAAFEKIGFDIIDLNFACPAPKVLRRGRGGSLLCNPEVAIEIYKCVREAVKCPVLIKLRSSFGTDDGSREGFWQICEEAAANGVDAIAIHGRSVKQRYRGPADWGIIDEAKRRFPNTTIIGSGDLFDPETIVSRLGSNSADIVAIARGAIGNPWIFAETKALLAGMPKPEPPGLTEQGRVILDHFEMIAQMRTAIKAVRYFRKFATGYCKRHPQRKKAQLALMAAKTPQQLTDTVKQWYGL